MTGYEYAVIGLAVYALVITMLFILRCMGAAHEIHSLRMRNAYLERRENERARKEAAPDESQANPNAN